MDITAILPLSSFFLSILPTRPVVNEKSGRRAVCVVYCLYHSKRRPAVRSHRPLPAATAVFLIAEGCLYLLFLTLDLLNRQANTDGLKYCGILLCLLMALLCALRGGDKLVVPALLLTAAADWFLLLQKRDLAVGVAIFLCVQTVYLIRLRLMGAPQALWLRGGLALLAGLALYALKMATPLTLLAGLYFSQLLSNTLLAWTTPNRRFAIGLTLFVCCDICVGLVNSALLSGGPLRLVSLGMWLFYLPSQVLIVLSALPKEVSHEEK